MFTDIQQWKWSDLFNNSFIVHSSTSLFSFFVWKNDKSENFQQVSTDFSAIREGKFTSLSVLSQLLLDNSREGGVNGLLAGILLIKEEVQGGVTADEGGSEPVLLLY